MAVYRSRHAAWGKRHEEAVEVLASTETTAECCMSWVALCTGGVDGMLASALPSVGLMNCIGESHVPRDNVGELVFI